MTRRRGKPRDAKVVRCESCGGWKWLDMPCQFCGWEGERE